MFVFLREKEGGLTSAERDDLRYGLEAILISEKMKEIRMRLEAGGTLPDPVWPDSSPLTLPLKNVSLAEWFNSDRENGNDENIKGALHARIQARGSSPGGKRPKHRSGGAHVGRGRPDAVQLGQGPSAGQAHRSGQQAGKRRADANQPTAGRVGAREDGA